MAPPCLPPWRVGIWGSLALETHLRSLAQEKGWSVAGVVALTNAHQGVLVLRLLPPTPRDLTLVTRPIQYTTPSAAQKFAELEWVLAPGLLHHLIWVSDVTRLNEEEVVAYREFCRHAQGVSAHYVPSARAQEREFADRLYAEWAGHVPGDALPPPAAPSPARPRL